jgi:hypothetical protein
MANYFSQERFLSFYRKKNKLSELKMKSNFSQAIDAYLRYKSKTLFGLKRKNLTLLFLFLPFFFFLNQVVFYFFAFLATSFLIQFMIVSCYSF